MLKAKCKSSYLSKNFTLIELLLVIAIIAILAALLLPSLFTARVRAHMANDTGNLKQIYQALIYYSEEYNGYLPYIQSIANDNDQSSKAIWLLLPYLNYDTKLFSPRVAQMDGKEIYSYMSTSPESAPSPGFAYTPIYQLTDDENDTGILRFSDVSMPNVPIIATFDGEHDNHVVYLTFNGEVN